MSSFRQYGGLNRAATNNIVRNQYSNSDNPTISNFLGLYNSKIVSESHLDLSGNSILNVNGIYFDNGTTIIDGSFNGDLTVNGNLEVKGENAVFLGNMDVQKNVVLSSTLEVGDTAIFYQGIDTRTLIVDENATITTLNVGGNTTLNGPTNVHSNVFLNNELEVVGNSTFDACLNILGDTTIYNTLNIGKKDISVDVISGTYTTDVQGTCMIYTFTTSGSIKFNFSGNYDVSYILVGGAGGGGGGAFAGGPGGGGGGGGQVTTGSTSLTSGTTYTITVGAGGSAGIGQASAGSSPTNGGNGSSSSFGATITAQGGRGGFCSSVSTGGQSGGGGSGGTGNTNPGGTGTNGGGGGGGSYNNSGGNGSLSNTNILFNGYGTNFGAGGGGGGGDAPAGSGGNAYAGNGNGAGPDIIDGTPNYGGGGGGGGGGNGATPGYPGGVGGSGVVIIYFDTSIPTQFDTVISNGNITTGGTVTAGTFVSGSDYRIKTDVKPLTHTFVIDQLNPVTYTNKLSGKQDTGFIAHEVQEIFPHLVTGEKDGEETQTLNYQGLIAILTREIQELKKRVEILEKK